MCKHQKHIEAQGKYANPDQLHGAVSLFATYKHKLPFSGVVSWVVSKELQELHF